MGGHFLEHLAPQVTEACVRGVGEHGSARPDLPAVGVSATSLPTWIEYGCGVGCAPRVPFVGVRRAAAQRTTIVRPEARITNSRLMTLATGVDLSPGIDACACGAPL